MIVRLATYAMATRFELVLAGEDGADRAGEARLRAVGEAALAAIEECERALSPFQPASLVSRVNALAAARPIEVDADTFELFETCAAIQAESGGAFDLTVAPLMRALGFRSPGGRPDSAAEIAGAARAVGGGAIELDRARRTVRFTRPGTALDLGAVGKGRALDLAAAVLREHGVERAFLHGGTSTALALGAPPGAAGWHAAVGRGRAAPVAHLCDAALSVSAGRGRTLEREGRTLGHVLDPRSGAPARACAVAAVIDRTAAAADARSTALLVLGLGYEPPGCATLVATGNGDDLRWKSSGSFPGASAFRLPTPPPLELQELP